MVKLLFASTLLGICNDLLLMKTLKLKRYPYTVFVSLCVILILHKAFDSQLLIIKGFLFAQILIFAGYIDAKTKSIPDAVHVAVILVGFIGIKLTDSALGLVLVPLPFLIAALIKNGSMGGGDIKLMGACGFVLGAINRYIGSCIGLSLAVAYCKIFRKSKNDGIALAPFLGIGCFAAFFIT